MYRDLFLFRALASVLNGYSVQNLGCNGELIVDEFGQKLLEELDYVLVSLSISSLVVCGLKVPFLDNYSPAEGYGPTVPMPLN